MNTTKLRGVKDSLTPGTLKVVLAILGLITATTAAAVLLILHLA